MSYPHAYTRRGFLHRGLTLVSTAAAMPLFLHRTARAMNEAAGAGGGKESHRIAVVIQLGGGNDGLNTVIPYGHDAYHRARPTLAVKPDDVLKLDEDQGLGLHASLTPLKGLFDEGLVSIVQGVGYPNPNRSHFKSMDIWQTADPGGGQGRGWVGRYFDEHFARDATPNLCVAIGSQTPLATQGRAVQPVTFEDPSSLRFGGAGLRGDVAATYQRINRRSGAADETGEAEADKRSQLAFVRRAAIEAQVSSDRIRGAAAQAAGAGYPRGPLGASLRLTASMIAAELPTRIYYVQHNGFDTHATQAGSHGGLLGQFAAAVAAFHADLKRLGHSGRVLTFTFSEFGRRVAENGSQGTDHGAAAPMFLIGDMIRPGLIGAHPSLTELDDGDLIHHTDFRRVYAAILDHWLKANSHAVLGGTFDPVGCVDEMKAG